MVKLYQILVLFLLHVGILFSQSTEHFADETPNATTFTDDGTTYTLTDNFHIGNYPEYGKTLDDQYIDNSDNILSAAGVVGSITNSNNYFYVYDLWIVPANSSMLLVNDGVGGGDVIIRGKLNGVTQFTYTHNGQNTNISSTNNYYTYIDLTAYNSTKIDELEFELTDKLRYLQIDEFRHLVGTAMPVELTSFTAIAFSEDVKLEWETATEVNNYGFSIERANTSFVSLSKDNEWIEIGFVAGHGNSNSPKRYQFIDENAPDGNLEYRLKQIDTDGQFEYYSQIAEVNFEITSIMDINIPTKFSVGQNFPNPFNPSTKIRYSIPTADRVVLIVYDVLGKKVNTLVDQIKNAGFYEIEFNADDLTSGLYFYKFSSGLFIETKKMMLIR